MFINAQAYSPEKPPPNHKKNHQKPSKKQQIIYFPVWDREFIRALIGHPLEYLQCLEFPGFIQINYWKSAIMMNEISYAFERVWQQMWTGVRLGTAEGLCL